VASCLALAYGRQCPVTVRPFPWVHLPRVKRGASAALSAFRRALELPSVPALALEKLSELIGSTVQVMAHSAGADLAATMTTNSLAVRLAPPAEPGAPPAWWVVLEVELALVVALVARVTRRPAPRVIHAGVATPSLVGAFAAIIAAATRRAGVAVTVGPVDPTAVPDAPPRETAIAGLSFVVDGEASHVRAFFPRAFLASVPSPLERASLAAIGPLPLELPIVACRALASAEEVALLSKGDVWMLDGAWALGSPSQSLRGRVWLCAGASEHAACADLEADGRVVLRDGGEELSWSPMSQETNTSTEVVLAVGDVPVVVRVEIGAATMTAHDWSALRPGDVLGLGSRVGSAVTLRVSGIAVAEGELVDLEGEVGVRIQRRLAATSR